MLPKAFTLKELTLVTALAVLILGATTAFAGTWAPPTAVPTGGEPDAPIIVNGDQTKAGALIVNATKGNGTYAPVGLDVVQGNTGIGFVNPAFPLVVSAGPDRVLNFRGDPSSFGTSQAGIILQGINTAQNAYEPISLESGGIYLNAATHSNVGIGTASPGAKLEVDSSGKILIGDGCVSAGYGGIGFDIAAFSNCTNYSLLGEGVNTFLNAPSGGIYFRIGNSEKMLLTSSGYLGIGTDGPARPLEVNAAMKFTNSSSDSNDGVIGSDTYTGFGGWGRGLDIVGINTSGARWTSIWGNVNVTGGQLQTDSGDIYAGGNFVTPHNLYAASNVYASDIRLKKDIQTLPDALDKISQLRGVSFLWKDPSTDAGEQIGLIAQEVEKVYPQLVLTNPKTGMKGVKYANLVGPLIEAVKELKSQNENLQKQNDSLKAAQAGFEARLEVLEKKAQ